MKTSFYFVLWIGIYVLIGFIGNQWLMENDFFVALAAVWGISLLINKATVNQRNYMLIRNTAVVFEIVYHNDYKRYLAIFRRHFLFNAGTLIYLVLSVIFLVMIHENWVITAIFALFALYSAKDVIARYKAYSEVKKAGVIELDEQGKEMYDRYKEGRDAGYRANELYPPATWKDKLLRGCDFGFAVISIILGITGITMFLPGLLSHGAALMGAAMYVTYGSLAFIFGVNDLDATIKGY